MLESYACAFSPDLTPGSISIPAGALDGFCPLYATPMRSFWEFGCHTVSVISKADAMSRSKLSFA